MTKATRASAAARDDPSGRHPSLHDLRRENDVLRAELERTQPLVGAALLTATAFRLRDRDAEITALRMLVQTIDHWEDQGAGA